MTWHPRLPKLLVARTIFALTIGASSIVAGCLPYTVGNTAQPLYRGERALTSSIYLIPNGFTLNDSTSQVLRGIDIEYRIGVSDRADIGFRFASLSGLVLNYKHRFIGDSHPEAAAVSWMLGAGVVGGAGHAQVEATLLASGAQRGSFTPYGGVRFMHIEPLNRDSWHDPPTVGAFLGVRIGNWMDALLPELAVYYDEPTGGFRKGNLIFVPSVSISGDWLDQLIGLRPR